MLYNVTFNENNAAAGPENKKRELECGEYDTISMPQPGRYLPRKRL